MNISDISIRDILKTAVKYDCSDIFIVAGKELSFKKQVGIEKISDNKLTTQDTDRLIRELFDLANRDIINYIENKDDDFSVSLQGLARFRVNTYYQRGSMAAVIRLVNFGVPNPSDIGIPDSIIDISRLMRGLVLITGPAGSGKSTTLACIIDAINTNRNAHIITIEDPIEYLHKNKLGIVSQRELMIDTGSYVKALRASLREAPDVILVGEMRDLDTIRVAMTAAETGHLVLSTLHTIGAANTIDRIIDIFPSEQQQQIRVELAQVLKKVVSQQLVQTANGNGVVPSFEIMTVNNAIKNLIRENRIHQIDSSIQIGSSDGMITMDDYLLKLYKSSIINKDSVLEYAINTENIKKKL